MDIKKAYTLGFLLGDSHLKDNGVITCTVSLKDRKILEDISLIFKNSTVSYFHKTDRDKKIFPSCRIYIPKRDFPEAKMLFSGNLKVDRHIPIISPEFERYLLLGFFDAEGCITWGVRKDRDRLWQKVQLSSQYRMLIGIQNILLKYDISSSIAPVRNSNHYVISISNELSVYKFYNVLYNGNSDIGLKRKRLNFDDWVGNIRKKYTINTGDTVKFINYSTATKYYGKDFCKEFIKRNDQTKEFIVENVFGNLLKLKDYASLIDVKAVSKAGMITCPLRIELG